MAGNFRRFRVAEKVKESANIASFHLVPADGAPAFEALPGQYLTFRALGPDGPLLKTYSLSGDVSDTMRHRITVKREGHPSDRSDLPDGVGSCWLHDQVGPGTEIEVAAPRGSFVLDETSGRPVVLLAGGVGLTPLLSMLHRLVAGERDVWFIHACENGSVHAMAGEVSELAGRANKRIRTHVAYRQPTAEDRKLGSFDSEGMIDKALLQSLLPLDDYDVYMCGPTPFMMAMFRLLTGLGISRERIAYEFFGKAMSLEALADQAERTRPAAGSKAASSLADLVFLTDPDRRAVPDDDSDRRLQSAGESALAKADTADAAFRVRNDEVIFERSGITAVWDDDAGSLLDLAERAGLAPEFSCRSGICNTCRCSIREGEVDYIEEPLDPPPAGSVLICCSRPRGRIVLDL